MAAIALIQLQQQRSSPTLFNARVRHHHREGDILHFIRLFPLSFVTRLARERLGVEAEVVPGGHLVALARPEQVAAALGA